MRLHTRLLLPLTSMCLVLGTPAALAAPAHFIGMGVHAYPSTSRSLAITQAVQFARNAGYDVDRECQWQFEPVARQRPDGLWETEADLVCDG